MGDSLINPDASISVGLDDLDFSVLTRSNQQAFLQLLDSCVGSKAIIWDKHLKRPFGRVCGFKQIKQQDVLNMYELSPGRLPDCSVEHVLYLVKPELSVMQTVAESVRSSRNASDTRKLHLVFVPRQSVICEQFLRDNEVLGRFSSISNLSIDFFTLDVDLISLEMEHFVHELLVYDNWSPLYHCACALDNLDTLYGPIQSVQAKGDWSARVIDLWHKKKEQDRVTGERRQDSSSVKGRPLIDQMIVIDRWCDLVTPMLTQLTYAGLIDELIGIKCSKTRLPAEPEPNSETGTGEPENPFEAVKELEITCMNDLYRDLRDLNFNAVGSAVQKKVLQIKEQMDARHNNLTVREYADFVKRLPMLQASRQSASDHTTLAQTVRNHISHVSFITHWQCEQSILSGVDNERVIPYIEELVANCAPLSKVLRLLCLQSLVADGIKSKVLDSYKRLLMQTYGFDTAEILLGLESAGLLRDRSSTGTNPRKPLKYASHARPSPDQATFAGIKTTFRLLQEEVDELNPNDVSYTYSGYAPLTARLCQYAATKGWAGIDDALRRIPGKCILDNGMDQKRGPAGTTDQARVCLVMIVGGCTYAELAAIRFLNSRQSNLQFLVATTHMTTGDRLIGSLSEVVYSGIKNQS